MNPAALFATSHWVLGIDAGDCPGWSFNVADLDVAELAVASVALRVGNARSFSWCCFRPWMNNLD